MRVQALSRFVVLAFAQAVVFAALAIPTLAQITTTGIRGIVRDPNGAVVPHATIIVTDNSTGVEQTTVSSGEGVFSFPNLQAGSHKLSAFDMSLNKDFKFTERWRMTIRAVALNFLNHPFFAIGNSRPTATTFGQVTSARGNRTVQLRASIEW